jgi:protein-S-isoprenylcysteine O-methyltransferase Ste14
LLLGSGVGLALAALAYYPALRYRVAVEEDLLAAGFGDQWAAYRERVPALIPRPARRPAS